MTSFQENSSPFLTTQLLLSYNRLLLFSRVGPIDLVTFISCSTQVLERRGSRSVCQLSHHCPLLAWSEETQRWSDSTVCCLLPLPDRAGSRQTPTRGRLGNAKGLKGVRTYRGELGCGQITCLAAGQQVKLTSSIQAMCLELV